MLISFKEICSETQRCNLLSVIDKITHCGVSKIHCGVVRLLYNIDETVLHVITQNQMKRFNGIKKFNFLMNISLLRSVLNNTPGNFLILLW